MRYPRKVLDTFEKNKENQSEILPQSLLIFAFSSTLHAIIIADYVAQSIFAEVSEIVTRTFAPDCNNMRNRLESRKFI